MATSYAHTIQVTWHDSDGERLIATNARAADGEDHRIVAVPASTTNLEDDVAFGVTGLQSVILVASGADLVVKTNSPTSPGDTFTLTAGWPRIWMADANAPAIFSVDVTKLFITNSSTLAGQLDLRVLWDSTP